MFMRVYLSSRKKSQPLQQIFGKPFYSSDNYFDYLRLIFRCEHCYYFILSVSSARPVSALSLLTVP